MPQNSMSTVTAELLLQCTPEVVCNTCTGDRKAAEEAYKKAEAKTAGSGPKMDMVFSTLKYAH